MTSPVSVHMLIMRTTFCDYLIHHVCQGQIHEFLAGVGGGGGGGHYNFELNKLTRQGKGGATIYKHLSKQ